MFTGIVATTGQIESVEPIAHDDKSGVRLLIHANDLSLADVGLGDSIAIQGACMTVTSMPDDQHFTVDVSRESLNKTTGLDKPGPVNLEKSLRIGDQIGGHLVSGHVDGLGTVKRFEPVGESWELVITAPKALGMYLAYKGSITVNGVSLTVNRVTDKQDGTEFSINLIPHTVEVTTLKHLKPEAAVNLEVDTIARYVQRMMAFK
ncbi:riboflavin synthase [Orrella daihaiensis]|uniref:Riboflavin synthase n=1 Tax=Orrella daihaiensis TaxID=2782176 RepID=A0ABY4AM42_9BURK|nr:riboflavin synthase [Orrella daihaiensis]UOD50155.1 riboflavin synthase [Orrella daihaiensis]